MRQPCLECFALTAVLIVNDDFRAGFARALCGVISRAVINNENVIEPFACSPSDVADVFFVLIRWNNRSGLGTNVFRHVERSRLSSRSFMPRLKTSQYSIQRFDWLTPRSLNLRSSRLCRGFPQRLRSQLRGVYPERAQRVERISLGMTTIASAQINGSLFVYLRTTG